jgi:hypothetical protein
MRYLIYLILIPAAVFTEAWLFMLLVGVVHAEWLPMVPTIGFWSAVLVSLMATSIGVAGAIFQGIGKGVTGGES